MKQLKVVQEFYTERYHEDEAIIGVFFDAKSCPINKNKEEIKKYCLELHLSQPSEMCDHCQGIFKSDNELFVHCG